MSLSKESCTLDITINDEANEHISEKDLWKILTDESLMKNENGEYTSTFGSAINIIYEKLFASDKSVFRDLIQTGAAIPMCDYVVHTFKNNADSEYDDSDINKLVILQQCLTIIADFADAEIKESKIIAEHQEFLPCMTQQLKKWQFYLSNKQYPEFVDDLINSSLTIVYNLTINRENASRMRDSNTKEEIIPYMKLSEDPDIRLTCLAALANLVDEQDSEILRTDSEVMEFLMEMIRMSLDDEEHRAFGWSALELARIVRRIAKNDSNKRVLVEHKVLQLLVAMASKGDIDEQREAVKSMWTLAFDEQNMNTMVDCCGVVETLVRLRSSNDGRIRKACNGALWTLREKLRLSDKYRRIANECFGNRQSTATASGHVMISYQWDSQELLKKVKTEIKKENIKIWMDIDDMEGSTIESMAAAVENAEAVLLCVSKQYKESENCRAEAEYAWNLKKPLIPLMMDRGYKPDGWLGILMGTKLYFDFSGQYDFDSKMEELIKEIRKVTKKNRKRENANEKRFSNGQITKSVAIPTSAEIPTPAFKQQTHGEVKPTTTTVSLEEVKLWTKQDVGIWLNKHNLSRKKFGELSGINIAFLLVMKKEVSGDYFYKTLKTMVKIKDLTTLSKFRFALDDFGQL